MQPTSRRRVAFVVLGIAVVACLTTVGVVSAATVSLNPVKDNTMFSESDTLSNGAGDYFFAGETALGEFRRGLLAFDIAGAVPAGATIDSVRLTLNLSKAQFITAPVSLHRSLLDWGEAGSDAVANEGKGAPAQPGDATWGYAFYTMTPWPAGGSFVGTASATTSTTYLGVYTWQSAQMAADVQGWLDNPSTDFGWVVVGDEASIGSAKRFDSRDNPTAANWPLLEIWYTETPTAAGDTPARDLTLYNAVPNPFNPSTTISFTTTQSGRVRLGIYDVSGALVATLVDGDLPPAFYELQWDGTGHNGATMASGVYFARLEQAGLVRIQKLTLLK